MADASQSGGLDIAALLKANEGQNYELFAEHMNPQFAKVLKTIGFDRCYVRGEGPYLYDTQGTKYLDLNAGYGVFNMGRNHPEIRRVLKEFLDLEYSSLVKLDAPLAASLLAEELKKRMPNQLDIVYFCNSGSEGIETAIKYAKCATGRSGILHCKKSFHGLTNGSLSINGDMSFREGFGPFLPDCREIPFNDLEALERELHNGNVAAFIVEPIQGKGVNIPAPGYLKSAAELCRKYGALFVADEVQVGMGRTGKFLASEHDGDVDPDIVVLAKSLIWRLRAHWSRPHAQVDLRQGLFQHATIRGAFLDLQSGKPRHGRGVGHVGCIGSRETHGERDQNG